MLELPSLLEAATQRCNDLTMQLPHTIQPQTSDAQHIPFLIEFYC